MMHLIADDLGCMSEMCGCSSDAWFGPAFEEFLGDVERFLRLRAEFQQYLVEKGDIE